MMFKNSNCPEMFLKYDMNIKIFLLKKNPIDDITCLNLQKKYYPTENKQFQIFIVN